MWLYKWDISDAFHRCLSLPGDIGASTFVVALIPTDISNLLCIGLVLPIGWFNSPYMFCAASETVADVTNGYLLDPTSAFKIYPPTAGTYSLVSYPTASDTRLQYVNVYMDDSNCATQGDVGQKHRASELTVQDLK